MFAVAFVNHFAQPWSLQKLRDYLLQARTDLLTQVIQPGRFSSPEPNLTFHIRERTIDGELLGLVMHDTRIQGEAQSYLAERGRILKQDDTAYLLMTDGHIVRRSKPAEPAQIIAFEKYAVDLDRFEQKAGEVAELRPRERYSTELISPDTTSDYYKSQRGMYAVELHERFSNPLYPLAFVMIAIAAAGAAHSTRQGRGPRMIAAFGAGAGLRLLGLAVNNLAVKNPAALPLLYALPAVASIIAYSMIRRQGPSRYSRALRRIVRRVWEPIAISAPVQALKRRFEGLGGGAPA
jgi:lipopolysaccharide export system permease protein